MAFACPVGRESSLVCAALLLEERMQSMRQNGKLVGLEDLAITAAINLLDELRRQIEELTQMNKTLYEKIAPVS